MITKIKYVFICFFLTSLANAQAIRKDKLRYWSENYSEGIIGNSHYKVDLIDSSKTSLFIKEALTVNNQLLSERYLTIPTKEDLINLFIINSLHQRLHKKQIVSIDYLIDSLLVTDIRRDELIDNYYKLIFTSVGNKNQPFDLKIKDFQLNSFGLENEKEKAIFYFRCIDLCYKQIAGYARASNNEKIILEYIDKYPSFNGKKYFEFIDFNFDDFKIELFNDQGETSYKHYFLNRIYTLLLIHLNCNGIADTNQEENSLLIEKSILLNEKYWSYCSEDIVAVLKTIRD